MATHLIQILPKQSTGTPLAVARFLVARQLRGSCPCPLRSVNAGRRLLVILVLIRCLSYFLPQSLAAGHSVPRYLRNRRGFSTKKTKQDNRKGNARDEAEMAPFCNTPESVVIFEIVSDGRRPQPLAATLTASSSLGHGLRQPTEPSRAEQESQRQKQATTLPANRTNKLT